MLPGESDQLAALVSQQRVVREATINVNAPAAKQTASDEEINAFWQQNQARFMAPEQFRVSYIKMDAASMQESASDDEIQSWYDQHKDQFTQPQRNRYSVIQTKTEADAKAVLAELQKERTSPRWRKKNRPILSLPATAAIWGGWKMPLPCLSSKMPG